MINCAAEYSEFFFIGQSQYCFARGKWSPKQTNQSPHCCSFRQTQEREEDQHVLNLVGEALRLLGNTLVALSDLRCNLATPPPRHLHVVRPMSHYSSPVLLQGGMHHHVPVGHCLESFFYLYYFSIMA